MFPIGEEIAFMAAPRQALGRDFRRMEGPAGTVCRAAEEGGDQWLG